MKNARKNQRPLTSNPNVLNSILQVARKYGRLLINEKEAGRLIAKMCSCLGETAGIRGAWIRLTDEHGDVSNTAESGFGKSFHSMLDIIASSESIHCVKTSAAKDDLAAIQNRPKACAGCPLADHEPDLNAFSTRLKYGDIVLGHFTILVEVEYFKEAEFRSLLQDIAEDISNALFNLKTESDKNLVEKRNLETKQRLQATLDASETAIFTKDKNGVFVDVNLSFAKFYDAMPEDLIGLTDYDLLSKKEADALRQTDKNVLQQGAVCKSENTNTVGGEKIVGLTTKVPLKNE